MFDGTESYGVAKFDISGNTYQPKNTNEKEKNAIVQELFSKDGEYVNMKYTYLDIPYLYASSDESIELIKAFAST